MLKYFFIFLQLIQYKYLFDMFLLNMSHVMETLNFSIKTVITIVDDEFNHYVKYIKL